MIILQKEFNFVPAHKHLSLQNPSIFGAWHAPRTPPPSFLPSPQPQLSQVTLFLLDIYRLYSVFSCFSCKFWTEISIQYGRRTNLPTAMSNMTVYSSTLPLPETIVRIVLDSAGVEKKMFLEDHFLSKFWPFGGWCVQTNDNWMRHMAQTCSLWRGLSSVPRRWQSVSIWAELWPLNGQKMLIFAVFWSAHVNYQHFVMKHTWRP